MHITSSILSLSSLHERVVADSVEGSVTVQSAAPPPPPRSPTEGAPRGDVVQLSAEAVAAMRSAPVPSVNAGSEAALAGAAAPTAHVVRPLSDPDVQQATLELKLRLLVAMVRAMTGREVRTIDTSAFAGAGGGGGPAAAASDSTTAASGPAFTPARTPAPAVTITASATHVEAERTTFAAAGHVTAADGRTLDVSVDLSMSRELVQHLDLTVANEAAHRLRDPLVVNFAGNAAELTADTFSFDLDADGQSEQVHALASGSGLLALDTHGDGMVHDGSQLVGQASGDAFADLRAADSDRNGWIDEADPIFSRLRLWIPGSDGKGQLLTLAEADVGAIGVASVGAAFDLRAGGQLAGRARAASVYLAESGGGGTVQQIDLAV